MRRDGLTVPADVPLPALFADGGVVKVNPSPLGGCYAWCLVDERGEFVTGRSGVLISTLAGIEALSMAGDAFPVIQGPVTNNVSEFVAAVRALEHVPAGWSGRLCSDSQVTLGRLFHSWKLTGIPEQWVLRGSLALQRIGSVHPVLLQGHPTKADLAAGVGKKRGYPVSIWNRWCDTKCQEEAAAYVRELARRTA